MQRSLYRTPRETRAAATRVLAVGLLMSASLFAETPVNAQQESTIVVEPAPDTMSLSLQNEDPIDHRLKHFEERSRRARISLIATSATTAVGIGLAAGGASQCDEFVRFGSDDYICNDTGDALIGVGGALFLAGSIGMIVSGIILGVSNKRIRELRREHRPYARRPVRYDPRRSAFVF